MLLRRTTCQIRTSIQVLLTFFPLALRLSPSCAHEYICTSKKNYIYINPFSSSDRLAQIVPITLLPNLWLLFMNQCSPSPIETNPAKGGNAVTQRTRNGRTSNPVFSLGAAPFHYVPSRLVNAFCLCRGL